MLAMESLPLSQPFTPVPLSSPTMESPRAGLPPPLLSLPTMRGGVPALTPAASMGRPSSSSSLSSVHTPPPYDTGLVYSPTGGAQTTSMLPSGGASSGARGHSPCDSVAVSPSLPGPLTTISSASSTGNSSVVTSPREPGTSSPGRILVLCCDPFSDSHATVKYVGPTFILQARSVSLI